MGFDFVQEYATEGAPMLVADLSSSAIWNGTDDDGTGVKVLYMGRNMDKLPKGMAAKPGRVEKKFKTLEEARKFQEQLITEFKKLNPEAVATRNPYVFDQKDGTRSFSVEAQFTSPYSKLVKSLKSGAQLVKLAAKGKTPPQAVVVEQGSGGHGVVAYDEEAGCLVLAKPHYATDMKKVIKALGSLKVPKKATGKVDLDGRLLVFPSAISARQLAQTNWKKDSLLEGGEKAFSSAKPGPLYVPNQKTPGAAYVKVPEGKYEFAYASDVSLGEVDGNVLFLRKS
jgi:hypothetical protein